MDKERRTSAAVQSSLPWRQRKELPKALSPSVLLPDPHVSSLSFRGSPSNSNGVSGGKGDMSKQHSYGTSCRSTETSKTNNKTFPQGRVMNKNSQDTHKKGFRGANSASNFAGKSKPAQEKFVPFEVDISDFPELAGNRLLKDATPAQRVCWGPKPRSISPLTQSSPLCRTSGRTGSPKQPDNQQIPTNAKPDSPTTSTVESMVTSWANVASQPPKKCLSKEKTINNNQMQTEEIAAQQEDEASGMKKRKKKKKKAKGAEDAEAESGGPAIYQEPPKFEDEDEFPGLTLALTRNERIIKSRNHAKLCNEENQSEVVQSADQAKEISPAIKTQPSETVKKGQVSGKKSKVPVQLDIGNMLAALEKKQQSQKAKQDAKPVVLSVTGGLPVIQKLPLVPKKPPWQQDKIAHNPLDSTCPLVKKGKQREVPKAKKPTPLKKVILKEREERKQKRLLEERGLLPEHESQPTNNDVSEEEQCDTNATDELLIPPEELNDQSEADAKNQAVNEDEEETVDDKTIKEETVIPVPCPANRPKLHSRKFRDYCSQMLSKDVDKCVTALLKELVRFQDRLYQKDPMKARMKRRIVMGLREVLKHLKLKKVKCVVISPNCERIQSKGGLDEALYTIIDTCREQGVPFVFALTRKALGRCVNKAVPVSLVGIFNYDGAQDLYHEMIELSSEARRAYEVMVSSLEWTSQAEEEQGVVTEDGLQIFRLPEEAETNPETTEPDDPEYMKVWKKMLEKDCNHKFLNFEAKLSNMCLDSECTENSDDEKS